MKKLLALIAKAKVAATKVHKAYVGGVAALPGLIAILAGVDPKLAASLTAVLVTAGVYKAPANKV